MSTYYDQIMGIMELSKERHVDTATFNHIMALEREIIILKSRFEDHDTGHLKTAVSVLENRIEELKREHITDYK